LKAAVVLLSWRRPDGTLRNIKNLNSQTVNGFKVVISNANPEISETIAKYRDKFSNLDIEIRDDSNEYLCFRRFFIAKELAESGVDVIFFIDDDVIIPKRYIELALSQYEDRTYSSAYTWVFYDNGSDYYKKRSRVYDNESDIKYCGAGVSMIDASIFLEPGLFNVPKGAYGIDDLWLSYYCDHVAGYKLKYLDIPGVKVGGNDNVALLTDIKKQEYNKKDFLIDLVKSGWNVS
jgi:hypothetical protein